MRSGLVAFVQAIVLWVLALPALGIDKIPTQDLPKLQDLPAVKRFAGSFLVFRDDVAFDEVVFPAGKVTYTDNKLSAAKSLAKSGSAACWLMSRPAVDPRLRCCAITSLV